MNRFVVLVLFAVLLALCAFNVSAQEVTPEPDAAPALVTPDPVVIVQPEGSLSAREVGLYLLTGVATLALCVVAYRLTTLVGVSFPPGTAESLNRAYETGQTADRKSVV